MQTCIREVKLYGDLAKFVGTKSLSGDIKTAADSIKFLVGNFPELQSHMSQKYYKVIVEDKPITIAIITVADSKDPKENTTADLIQKACKKKGIKCIIVNTKSTIITQKDEEKLQK